MRILLSAAIAFAAVAILTPNAAEAQYQDGYRFGSGINFSGGQGFFGNGRFITPREQPPYFATFPPVYYSGIVPRPYGYSPFALPPGIAPIEVAPAAPLSISNSFFDAEVAPVSNEASVPAEVLDSNGNKLTWLPNPYIETLVLN